MIGRLTEIIFRVRTEFFNPFCLPVLKCFNNTNILLPVGWLQIKLGWYSDFKFFSGLYFYHWPTWSLLGHGSSRHCNSFKLITLILDTFASLWSCFARSIQHFRVSVSESLIFSVIQKNTGKTGTSYCNLHARIN